MIFGLFGCVSGTNYHLSNNTPESLYNEAQALYQEGMYEKSIEKYKIAANQGSISAQWDLGIIYQNGRGVTKNYKEAIKWFSKAAQKGDKYAQFNLGYMYYIGQGTTKDAAENGIRSVQENAPQAETEDQTQAAAAA